MYLLGINNIDPADQSITLTLHVKLSWRDDRIVRPKNHSVSISTDLLNKFWNPDFYIYDLNYFKTLKVFNGLQGGIEIIPKGTGETGKYSLK